MSIGTVLEVLDDGDALARRVAEWVSTVAGAKHGTIAIALAGGSTPRRLYQCLATPPWCDEFPWPRTHWFWGDERFVPHDDPRSNYRLVHETLLARAPVPPAHVHPIPTEDTTPAAAAESYQKTLESFYGSARLDPSRPLFDITLLGLGADGHTASLFPGSIALTERQRWSAAVTDAGAEHRITLTWPALESSRHAAFLVTGSDKRAVFARLRRGDQALPAARLRPVGQLRWFADTAAAGEIP